MRQRLVANLGRLDRLRGAGELDRHVASLARYAERTKVVDLAAELQSEWARECWIPLVCERLLGELGVEAELERAHAGRRIRAPLVDAVLALVANRLSEPCSKVRLAAAHRADPLRGSAQPWRPRPRR